jgi:hypothetical protein
LGVCHVRQKRNNKTYEIAEAVFIICRQKRTACLTGIMGRREPSETFVQPSIESARYRELQELPGIQIITWVGFLWKI